MILTPSPFSSYSFLVIHYYFSKSLIELTIEPPIHAAYLLSGLDTILFKLEFSVFNSAKTRSLNPLNIVFPPDKIMFYQISLLRSKGRPLIEFLTQVWMSSNSLTFMLVY